MLNSAKIRKKEKYVVLKHLDIYSHLIYKDHLVTFMSLFSGLYTGVTAICIRLRGGGGHFRTIYSAALAI